MGPTVWELEGPMAMVKRSVMLNWGAATMLRSAAITRFNMTPPLPGAGTDFRAEQPACAWTQASMGRFSPSGDFMRRCAPVWRIQNESASRAQESATARGGTLRYRCG